MVPSEENQLVPKEVESAAEEPRVLCIIQDTTNSKTVNERVTLNLPASTPLKRLFEDVASKVGYVNGTFDLMWGNGDNVTDTTPIDQNSDKTILDVGFEPGKKNFLHLTDKDGEQPHIMTEESGTTDESAQDRFIGPLPREGSVGCTSDYVTQSYSYSSVLSKSDTGFSCLWKGAVTCRLRYQGYFGGVTALTRDQFSKVNGFSNNYWGWGGEDDDLRIRVEMQKMRVVRPSADVARYTMIFHKRDHGNEENGERMKLLRQVSRTWKTDGLNSCSYKLLSVEHNPLYINITVDFSREPKVS